MLLALATAAGLSGCATPAPRNTSAIRAYYDYRFTDAREGLRRAAETQNDEQVLLNNLRLGMAALADGDFNEGERALGRVFDLLSTAGLNADRTTAAVLLNEGVRIWKGEPFEQALAYHYVSTLYATAGDWENARAAAANALFRLTDFGRDQDRTLSDAELARREAQRPGYLDSGYTAVDTNFALGFLMQAIASDLSGASGSGAQFDAALAIDPGFAPMVERLRAREYDTLLIVDYGKGPTKIAYGPDGVYSQFIVQDETPGSLVVRAEDRIVLRTTPTADVNAMARDHRWNNLEDVRRAKQFLGDALIAGGFVTTAVGSNRDSDKTQLAGLGLILAGMLMKSGAQADTRYIEFMPACVYLAPVKLGEVSDVSIAIEGGSGARYTLPDFAPGVPGQPRVVYVRLHGPDSPQPAWLTARDLQYTNDAVPPVAGARPWILGGRDVSTPSRAVVDAYRQHSGLGDLTLLDLQDLYRAEGILIGSGMEDRPDEPRNPSYRHILDRGRGLFTPQPYSMGYKQLMYRRATPYQPQSSMARQWHDATMTHRAGSDGAKGESR